jgi:glycosyltransferase involved in cell wall biosynthesis
MPKPLVSIVTPSYNQVQFIEACILSVLKQDYLNIEFIIFDGGSTDGSVEIIKKYSDKLAYWVSEKDNGQSDAINKGWKMAKGDILFYLNSDDLIYDHTTVGKIVAMYEANPEASVFYGDCVVINEGGEKLELKKAIQTNSNELLKERVFAKIMFQAASFFNTRYVREIDYLDVDLHYCMDYKLIVDLSFKGKMILIDEPVACFRIHANSKSHNGRVKMMHEFMMIKYKYKKLYALKYFYSYLKFRIFTILPLPIQKKINLSLYKSLHSF